MIRTCSYKLYFVSDAQKVLLLLRTYYEYIRVISDHYTDHPTLVLFTDIGGYFFQDYAYNNYLQNTTDLTADTQVTENISTIFSVGEHIMCLCA
jgi:hypothetical protein